VEFSDFQCSFCRKFWKETLPKIEAEYINTGKVRFVYRHLIALGPFSEAAAQAAECAGEQGKFWPYHDILFERAGGLGFTAARLKEYAGGLGLDRKGFDACLASGRHRDRIRQETEVARYLGATGTPTFLINGQRLIGAHPFETFDRIVDLMLADAEGKAPTIRIAPGPATAPAKK
jgi:protein-disulfide isomerase